MMIVFLWSYSKFDVSCKKDLSSNTYLSCVV